MLFFRCLALVLSWPAGPQGFQSAPRQRSRWAKRSNGPVTRCSSVGGGDFFGVGGGGFFGGDGEKKRELQAGPGAAEAGRGMDGVLVMSAALLRLRILEASTTPTFDGFSAKGRRPYATNIIRTAKRTRPFAARPVGSIEAAGGWAAGGGAAAFSPGNSLDVSVCSWSAAPSAPTAASSETKLLRAASAKNDGCLGRLPRGFPGDTECLPLLGEGCRFLTGERAGR